MEVKAGNKPGIRMLYVFTLIKCIYPIVLAMMSVSITHTVKYALLVAIESVLILIITNIIADKNQLISWIAGILLWFPRVLG